VHGWRTFILFQAPGFVFSMQSVDTEMDGLGMTRSERNPSGRFIRHVLLHCRANISLLTGDKQSACLLACLLAQRNCHLTETRRLSSTVTNNHIHALYVDLSDCFLADSNSLLPPPPERSAKYCDEYVGLSVCLSARITRKPHGRTSPSVHFASGRGSVVSSFSGAVAICHVLPVLWMTPCFPKVALWRVICS